MFLCFRKDLDAIVVRSTFETRDEMIETNPVAYFTTDHHRPYPWVLARVGEIEANILPDLLRMGWQIMQREKAPAGRRRKKS